MMVLVMLLEMLGEVVDSLGENSDLNLRRTGVALVSSILFHNSLFFCLCHFFHLIKIFASNVTVKGQVNTGKTRFTPKTVPSKQPLYYIP